MITYKKILLIVLLNVSFINISLSQIQDSLEFLIKNDTIRVRNKNNKILVNLEIRNKSISNVLFYAFCNIEEAIGTSDFFLQNDLAASSNYCIEKEGNQILPDPHLFDNYEGPISKEYILKRIQQLKYSYILNCLLVRKNDKENKILELDIKDFDLIKGQYKLYIIYSCGNRLTNFVSEKRQASDTDFFDARIFKGFLISNKVVLIVE